MPRSGICRVSAMRVCRGVPPPPTFRPQSSRVSRRYSCRARSVRTLPRYKKRSLHFAKLIRGGGTDTGERAAPRGYTPSECLLGGEFSSGMCGDAGATRRLCGTKCPPRRVHRGEGFRQSRVVKNFAPEAPMRRWRDGGSMATPLRQCPTNTHHTPAASILSASEISSPRTRTVLSRLDAP